MTSYVYTVKRDTIIFILRVIVEWDKQVLLEAWIVNPKSCCEQSGVVPPSSLNDRSDTIADHELSILNASTSVRDFTPTTVS